MRALLQAAAVGHAGHDLACSVLFRGELEGEVEHRDHHVEPFDRELLLPEERLAEVALEPSTSERRARSWRLSSASSGSL